MTDSKFLMGDKITLIDFTIGGFFVNVVLNPNSPLKQGWSAVWAQAPPKLQQYIANFQTEMGPYLEKRPQHCHM